MELLNQFASQHPFIYGAGAFALGAMGPKLWTFMETSGVDWLIGKWQALQKRLLLARGFTPEQVEELERHEAAALRRAAEDLEKDDTPKAS